MPIVAGQKVKVKNAFGETLDRRALSGVEEGHRFEVVWVCTEEDWAMGMDKDQGVPWPADAVEEVQEARV
jgi:hypothetical protein